MSRFPFPIPYSWYQVGRGAELKPGDVKPLYFFGRDLVLWRDADGVAHLQDAICPHLGAHLGHGGHVDGCALQCPFHGWMFDGDGRNVEIPYADRANNKACLRTYPLVERNTLLMAWYHPEDIDPLFEVPEVPEFNDPENFSEAVGRSFQIPAAWQEIAENQVDVAHFRYVHNVDIVPEVAEYRTDGHQSYLRSTQKFPTPRGVVDGRIDVDTTCPGFGVIRFTGIVDTVLLGCNTPVDADNCQLNFTFSVRRQGDEASTSAVGQAFVDEVSRQVQEDIPIWRYKGHVTRPALASTDAPYMKFRKWASQFYVEPYEYDRAVYPPLPPSSSEPEAEGVVKHTASARLKGEDDLKAGVSIR